MITFGPHHQAAFENSAREDFVARTLEFLEEEHPDWIRFTPRHEQTPYIVSILDLAHQCHLFEALSAQKLVHYHLEYSFPIPLLEAHVALLDRPGVDETQRLLQFHEYITSDGAITIVSVEQLGKLYAEHLRATQVSSSTSEPVVGLNREVPHGAR